MFLFLYNLLEMDFKNITNIYWHEAILCIQPSGFFFWLEQLLGTDRTIFIRLSTTDTLSTKNTLNITYFADCRPKLRNMKHFFLFGFM